MWNFTLKMTTIDYCFRNIRLKRVNKKMKLMKKKKIPQKISHYPKKNTILFLNLKKNKILIHNLKKNHLNQKKNKTLMMKLKMLRNNKNLRTIKRNSSVKILLDYFFICLNNYIKLYELINEK